MLNHRNHLFVLFALGLSCVSTGSFAGPDPTQQLNTQIQAQLQQIQEKQTKATLESYKKIQAQLKQMNDDLGAQIKKVSDQTQAQMKKMQEDLQIQIKKVQADAVNSAAAAKPDA